MPEQQIWYVCEDCGCRVPQSGMTKVKNGKDLLFRCAKHLTKVHHREASCTWPGCKEIFPQSKSGYVSKFCPKHKKINKARVDQEYRESRVDLNARAVKKAMRSRRLYDPSKIHCANRLECCGKYDGHACLPCKNCQDYRLEHGNVDPMAMRRDGEASRLCL